MSSYSLHQVTSYKPIARCSLEELAAMQITRPSGGVLSAERAFTPEQIADPQNYRVEFLRDGFWIIVNERGKWANPMTTYPTEDAANDAISEMIADDDADRHANRGRHEQKYYDREAGL